MDADKRIWKHQTAKSYYQNGDPIGIDLFDDEREGFTAIYIRFANGLLYPARDVNMSKPEHAASVIAAWEMRGGVQDHRTKQITV